MNLMITQRTLAAVIIAALLVLTAASLLTVNSLSEENTLVKNQNQDYKDILTTGLKPGWGICLNEQNQLKTVNCVQNACLVMEEPA